MPVPYKLGKLPAVHDPRVPRMSVVTENKLPQPPLSSNWYAKIGDWPMLANDAYGDCVEAAILHIIQQMSSYAGIPLVPTEQEAIDFYAFTGFTPSNPATDQGTYVLGTGGAIDYWAKHGVKCGGQDNHVTGFMQITHKNPTEWMQGIHFFGGLLTGFSVPASLMEADEVPYVWRDFTGPSAGGHEILINGYETLPDGRYYDLISWGKRYRATEEFLQHVVDEVVVVIDPAEFNARGVTPLELNLAQITQDMNILRNQRG